MSEWLKPPPPAARLAHTAREVLHRAGPGYGSRQRVIIARSHTAKCVANEAGYLYITCPSVYRRYVRLHKHLAELLQFLRPADLLREQRQLYDVEELVVELVCLVEVLLLHVVPHATVFAVRACQGRGRRNEERVRGVGLRLYVLFLGKRS